MPRSSSCNRDDGYGGGDEGDHSSKVQRTRRAPSPPPPRPMRNRSAAVARTAAVVGALALAFAGAAVTVGASAAAVTAPPPAPPLDVAPAPGALMAVPPPAPPPVLAPSEAAERFARSLILESVGAEEGAGAGDDGGGGVAASAAPAAAAAAAAGGSDSELLRWAISHSDPSALRDAAKQAEGLSLEERQRRVAELRAVLEKGGGGGGGGGGMIVSDTDRIKGAVAELNAFLLEEGAAPAGGDSGKKEAAEEGAARAARALLALERLADLAGSIDHANDLRPLGALAPLAALLEGRPGAAAKDPSLRAAAARCVGVAASNNAVFQGDLLAAHPQAVRHLLDALEGPAAVEEQQQEQEEKLRLPALFAASTFARSAAPASREAFFAAGGLPRLLALLMKGEARRAPALALNAAVLVGDLADLAAAGDDGGALAAAAAAAAKADEDRGGGGGGGGAWRALAEGLLGALGRSSAPAAVDKALSAVRALSGLDAGRAALAAAGGEQRLAEAAAAAVAAGGGGGGGAEYRRYLSELAQELSVLLKAGGGGDSSRSEL